jgi:hypothetical protein
MTSFTLTLANGSERDALWEMIGTFRGLLIGDKGYRSASLKQELKCVSIELETALRANIENSRDPAGMKLLQRERRLIETVMGQLSERFHIEKI